MRDQDPDFESYSDYQQWKHERKMDHRRQKELRDAEKHYYKYGGHDDDYWTHSEAPRHYERRHEAEVRDVAEVE